MRRNRLRTGLFVLVALGAAILVTALYLAPSWDPIQSSFESTADLERKSIDARFQVRGEREPRDDLVIVGIDATTFQDLHRRWPFPRRYHARVIDRLHRDGARLIAYDVQFTEPSELGPADDNALILACRRARTCLMVSTEANSKGETAVFGGPPGQEYARLAGVGMAQFKPDPDGVIRKMPLEHQSIETFGVAAAETLTRREITEEDAGGRVPYIDFYGAGVIPEVPFSQLCDCSRDVRGRPIETKQAPSGFFKDKIVVIGPVAAALQDVHATSAGGFEMPGVEVQANAIATALAGFPLRDSPAWLDVLLIVAFAFVAPLASVRLRLWGIAVALAVAVLYTVLTQLLFNGGTIISFTYPVGSLLLSTVGSLAVHYVTEAFERERVRDQFTRFVPESVVGQVLDQADGARLGGVGRYATVMFSDLRGFTSFAEQLEPDQVIRILNRYLTAMVDDAIIPHGGTLVDYMGDGIMAVFGAPIEMPDHADRALAAARAKLVELEKFNQWMKSEYGFDKSFRMGIGLNSGQVMSGNVGSEKRLAYTAIGDTTNTAARLEGMTKGTDYMLFMADSTKRALSEEPADLAFVGEYEIRGRLEKLSIWTVGSSRKEKDEGASFASVAKTKTLADK